MNITVKEIEYAIKCASKKRKNRPDVKFVWLNMSQCIRIIYESLENGTWMNYLKYTEKDIVNKNGKSRHLLSPNFYTLILQHLAVNIIINKYNELDNSVGLNCKPKHGITADNKLYSVIKRLKHIYYDLTYLNAAVIIDQRKCYEHINKKQLRRALKFITRDKWVIDFIVDVSFCGKTFPIGTPSSPPMHHIIMLIFDIWLKNNNIFSVRYADDVFIPAINKEEAQTMKWRVKQFWWYVYGIRAKRYTQRVVNLSEPSDFCGYVFHRNFKKTITSHDKGYTTIRRRTFNSAMNVKTDKSYASYFGLLKHADMFRTLERIEKNMNLAELTKTIRVDRKLDADNIDLKELALTGTEFTIYEYDLRCDAKGEPNWIKCLIGIPELDQYTGEPTGRILAKEFHGSADAIIKFHVLCEKQYGKQKLLPMTGMKIEQRCGYIYKGSTNVIKIIDEQKYG